ncbi:MAG: hypothetical protein IPK67_19595 [Planctomycetes bacterium]|nr:hypothetical protein [Planctomycetota bacterium]
MLFVGGWKARDLARPLDGHWYLEGADAEGREALPLTPGEGWASDALIGWPESGARRLTPTRPAPPCSPPRARAGRIALAIRGPVGSALTVGQMRVTVEPSVTEVAEEGAGAPLPAPGWRG